MNEQINEQVLIVTELKKASASVGNELVLPSWAAAGAGAFSSSPRVRQGACCGRRVGTADELWTLRPPRVTRLG